MVAMDVDRPREVADRFCQFPGSLLRNAIVSVRQVDVAEAIFVGQLPIRFGTIDTDHRLHTQIDKLLERRIAGRQTAGNHPVMQPPRIGQMLGDDFFGCRPRSIGSVHDRTGRLNGPMRRPRPGRRRGREAASELRHPQYKRQPDRDSAEAHVPGHGELLETETVAALAMLSAPAQSSLGRALTIVDIDQTPA